MTNYNLSFMDTSNTLADLFAGVNNIGNGIIGIGILLLLWVILFAAFKNYETVTAMLITSFIVTIVAGLLWFSSLLAWYVAVVPLMMLVASVIVSFFKD